MFLLLFFMFLAGKSWISLVDIVLMVHPIILTWNLKQREIRKWFV